MNCLQEDTMVIVFGCLSCSACDFVEAERVVETRAKLRTDLHTELEFIDPVLISLFSVLRDSFHLFRL